MIGEKLWRMATGSAGMWCRHSLDKVGKAETFGDGFVEHIPTNGDLLRNMFGPGEHSMLFDLACITNLAVLCSWHYGFDNKSNVGWMKWNPLKMRDKKNKSDLFRVHSGEALTPSCRMSLIRITPVNPKLEWKKMQLEIKSGINGLK